MTSLGMLVDTALAFDCPEEDLQETKSRSSGHEGVGSVVLDP